MIATLAAAEARLRQLVPVDDVPSLEEHEVDAALAAARVWTTWQASTAYAVGDKIAPVVPNGRRYRCASAGTTGATAPPWPTSSEAAPGWGLYDNTVTWLDDGPAGDAYDVNQAAKELWTLKAAKAALLVDTSDGTLRENLSQIRAHCLSQAARFEGVWIA